MIDADGRNPVQLTTGAGDNTAPSWSPDGAKIAFGSTRTGSKGIDIWSAVWNGTTSTLSGYVDLSNQKGDDVTPSWSPAAVGKIAFASNRNQNQFEIYTMTATGASQTRLTFDHRMREQSIGTMEVLLSTPTPISVLLAGSFVFPMLLTTIDLVLSFGLGLGVFGNGLRVVGVLYAIPLLILTLASFCAFGIVSAGLLVLIKRGDPLTAPFTLLTSILAGRCSPCRRFRPSFRRWRDPSPRITTSPGLREALLTSAGWSDILPDMLVLAAFDVILLPLSVNVFARALAAARRSGTLANY